MRFPEYKMQNGDSIKTATLPLFGYQLLVRDSGYIFIQSSSVLLQDNQAKSMGYLHFFKNIVKIVCKWDHIYQVWDTLRVIYFYKL